MFEQITDASIIEGYLTDASNLRGHATVLVRPSSTEEVAEVVSHCQAEGIPLTITAARTSTTGSPVPEGCWLLSTERLTQVELLGHDYVIAQAGVLLGELQDQIEATGRFFPPDPTSRYDSTLGAAIACNASGARSFRYGPTRPWIEALQVVLPTGEILEARRGDPIPSDWPAVPWQEPAVKTAAGYAPPADLVDCFIGQEGTLGIVTQATLRLTDLPADILGLVLFFPSRTRAVDAMRQLRDHARADARGPVSPRCIEYFDHACLALARERGIEVPDGAQAALFCEQEVAVAGEDEEHMAAWWELLESLTSLADDTILAADEPGRKRLHAFRHAIPAGINERVVRQGMPKVGTDLAVPDEALDAMMDAYEAAPIEHVLFGHLGDNHLHLNMLPTTPEELALAKSTYDDLARQAIALGGTVSAEHGIGKLKVRQLAWMVGEETLERFRALKRHLDPAWILGRGTMFAAPADEA